MATSEPILVVGGGIAGITAALEAAEAGAETVLVEREPFIGGRVVRLRNYFPKICPPTCGMEINTRRIEKNPRVRVMVASQVASAQETDKGFSVTIKTAPAYVNDRCTACGECSKVCPATIKDDFNLGMSEVTAIRQVFPSAWPKRYVLERSACPADCKKCVEACAYDAIDLDAKQTEETIEAGAAVVATGWKPYPLEKLTELGGGVLDDVIANVQMERLANESGPTGGKILKPSDHQPPASVAFVQCAGSRDVNHLPYCSGVCCLASLKQAMYVKEQLPDARVTLYYIDRRTPGRNEDVLTKVAALEGVGLVKGKVGKIERNGSGLKLRVEDADAGVLQEASADLVVLATGMVPNEEAGLSLARDPDKFALDGKKVVVAGVARRPEDVASSVRDATGAAAKAMAKAGGRA